MSYGERYDLYDRRRSSDVYSRRDFAPHRDGKGAAQRPRNASDQRPRDQLDGGSHDRPRPNLPPKSKSHGTSSASSSPGPSRASVSEHELSPMYKPIVDILWKAMGFLDKFIRAKQDRAHIKSIVKKKKAELDRARQTEFASVSEMCAKSLATAQENLTQVEIHIKSYEQELTKLFESLARRVTQQDDSSYAPTCKEPGEIGPPSPLDVGLQKLDAQMKAHKIDISSLKNLKTDFEAHKVDISTLKTDIEHLKSKDLDTEAAGHVSGAEEKGPGATEEISTLKAELESVQKENVAKSATIDQLMETVNKLVGEVKQQGEQLQALRSATDKHETRLDEVDTTLHSHDELISEVDVDNLKSTADFFAFEKPTLEASIKAQQVALDTAKRLASEANSKAEKLHHAQDSIIQTFGGFVDVLRQRTTSLEEDMETVKSMAQNPPVTTSPAADAISLEQIQAQVDRTGGRIDQQRADLDACLEALKKEVEDLRASHNKEDARLGSEVEKAIKPLRQHFDARCDSIGLMVETLDMRVNNMTTKELFQHIAGHMEQLYPDQRQIQVSLAQAISKLEELESKLETASRDLASSRDEVSLLRESNHSLYRLVKQNGDEMIKTGRKYESTAKEALKKRKLEHINGIDRANGHGGRSPSASVSISPN
ncbi:uncharacterized protein E0L32_006413 [Thyridium curvatum]|uniref:Uncharacterized protein n=1 Tax=Thyridium curvatum TaxID=1093900 RepID=A0A507AZY2_9PEZI|nr:uncharacterized protein E0L32_006413 [Thyridium curvatum]TPX13213.1 hypothetical protein E0L32_006413 [Thyridium curvatum]